MESQEKEASLTDFLSIFFRHWLLATIVLGVSLLSVPLLSKLKPPSYESRAQLLIKFGKQALQQNPAGSDTAASNYIAQWEMAVKSEIQILRNEYLAQKIVEEMGTDFDALPPAPPPAGLWERVKAAVTGLLKRLLRFPVDLLYKLGFLEDLPAREAAIQRVLKGIEVQNIADTSVLEVTFRSGNLAVTQKVLDRLIQLYVEHHMELHRTPGVVPFFDEQLEAHRGQLQEAEDRYEALRKQHDIASIKEQISLLLTNSNELLLKKINFDLELIVLLGKYPEGSPEVRKKQEVIAETQNLYQKAISDLESLNGVMMEHEQLNRNVSVAEKAFFLYSAKSEENRILDAMDAAKISNVSVIQPASAPLRATRILPFLPDRGLFILLALFLGLLIGSSLAVLADYLDATIQDGQDLEDSLGVKVWGVIPEHRQLRRWAR